MSKRCPNCGLKESDDAKLCHICGKPLVQDEDDFEYDFSDHSPSGNVNSSDASASSGGAGVSNQFVQNGYDDSINYVPTKIGDVKANKLRKNIFSLASEGIVICILRFIFAFVGLSDANEIKEMLSSGYIWEEELGAALNTYVNLYYCAIVILALYLVVSIVLSVFAYKVKNCTFPVQDDAVFKHSKKVFIVSIPTVVIVVAYFVVEIVSVLTCIKLGNYFEEPVLDFAQTIVALIVDIVLVAAAIMCMFSSLKLSKSKLNS